MERRLIAVSIHHRENGVKKRAKRVVRAKDDTIVIVLESGANAHSKHELGIDVQEMGFADRAAWDAATDEARTEAILKEWREQGLPEVWWQEVEE